MVWFCDVVVGCCGFVVCLRVLFVGFVCGFSICLLVSFWLNNLSLRFALSSLWCFGGALCCFPGVFWFVFFVIVVGLVFACVLIVVIG